MDLKAKRLTYSQAYILAYCFLDLFGRILQ